MKWSDREEMSVSEARRSLSLADCLIAMVIMGAILALILGLLGLIPCSAWEVIDGEVMAWASYMRC